MIKICETCYKEKEEYVLFNSFTAWYIHNDRHNLFVIKPEVSVVGIRS
jgi:hypothetical protein